MKDEYNLNKKEIVKQKLIRFFAFLKNEKKAVSFQKKLSCFSEARQMCDGYEAETIFDKVKNAVLEVKAGNAYYERDGCLFYEKDYYLQLIAVLFTIFFDQEKLNIIDFGGSLGSMYYQNKDMLIPFINNLTWNIVEQRHFVEWGGANLEDDILKFYYSVDEIEDCNCVIFGSSLQYLEDYEEYLEKISQRKYKYIILDRTAVCDEEWFSIEVVHEPIYEAKYPVHVFREDELILLFKGLGYGLNLQWVKDFSEIFVVDDKVVRQKSFLFVLE